MLFEKEKGIAFELQSQEEKEIYKEVSSSIPKDRHLEVEKIPKKSSRTPLFPTSIMPNPIADFIKQTAECMPCSSDYVGLGVLITSATAIGNSAVIQMDDDWTEPAVLFGANVGEPSALKSPASKRAINPLQAMQKESYQLYLAQLDEFDDRLKEYEQWKKDKKSKPEEEPILPEEPTFKQFIVTDTTMEALADVIENNPRGVLAYHDELTGFIGLMDKYRGGNGDDKQKWLSIFSVTDFSINRVSKKPRLITKPFVSIYGNITPDNLNKLISTNQDGFADRFLFAYPDKVVPYYVNKTVEPIVKEQYYRIVEQLLDLHKDSRNPLVVRFTSESKSSWQAFHDMIIAKTESPEYPKRLESVFGKFKGIFSRIILIIHLLKYACKETARIDFIDKDTVEQAYELTAYFIEHAKKVYNFIEMSDMEMKIEMIKEYSTKFGDDYVDEENCLKGKLSNIRKISRKYHLEIEYINEVLQEMVNQGMGCIINNNPKGRASYYYFHYDEHFNEE